MTYEEMVQAIQALGDDAEFDFDEEEACFFVTFQDFEGFDVDWSEIMRKFDDVEAVFAFEDMLEEQCISYEGDYYVYYHFDEFDVRIGYASFDI